MKKKASAVSTSPLPTKPVGPSTIMTFPEAMQAVIAGKAVAKLDWPSEEFYVLLRDDRLVLHKPDGEFHPVILSGADLYGTDWAIVFP